MKEKYLSLAMQSVLMSATLPISLVLKERVDELLPFITPLIEDNAAEQFAALLRAISPDEMSCPAHGKNCPDAKQGFVQHLSGVLTNISDGLKSKEGLELLIDLEIELQRILLLLSGEGKRISRDAYDWDKDRRQLLGLYARSFVKDLIRDATEELPLLVKAMLGADPRITGSADEITEQVADAFEDGRFFTEDYKNTKRVKIVAETGQVLLVDNVKGEKALVIEKDLDEWADVIDFNKNDDAELTH